MLFECDLVFVNHGSYDEPDYEVYVGGHRQWKAETFGLKHYEDSETNFFLISREKLAAVRCARGLTVQTVGEYLMDISELEGVHVLVEIKHHGGGMPFECIGKIIDAVNAGSPEVTLISFNHGCLLPFKHRGLDVGLMLRSVPTNATITAMINELRPTMVLCDQFMDSPALRSRIHTHRSGDERRILLGVFTVNDTAKLPRLLGGNGDRFCYDFVITDNGRVMETVGSMKK